jgi:hypothetical protein
MGAARFFVRLCAAAVVAAAALAVTGVAGAASNGALSIQVFPSTLLSGGAGVAVATFTNTGDSTLNHVVLTVNLGTATFGSVIPSSGCTNTTSTVTCTISPAGGILIGQTVKTTVEFTAPSSGSSVTISGTATWGSPNTGKPNGTPPPRNTATDSKTVNLFSNVAGANSSCKAGGDHLSANNGGGGQQIDVTAGDNTLELPCTPIVVGIDNNGVFFTELPTLTAPGTVVLTYTQDETLPFVAEGPAYLHEYPNYPSLSGELTVPACGGSDPYVQSPNGPATIPTDPSDSVSTDSCVYRVDPTDDTSLDGGFPDYDTGTITLHVTGSATGDPGYH